MPSKPQSQNKEFDLSDKEFRFLANLANAKTGIMLPDNKRDMVYSRLVRRLRALKLDSFSNYCELLSTNAADAEIPHLINAITTNLTHFFRESHHFEHLETQVIQKLLANNTKKIRLWSAGCSAGMEPYSLAMCLANQLGERKNIDAKILATDIDTNMLDKCVAGEYSIDEYENIPVKYKSLVNKNNANMLMGEKLRELISFKHLNLLDDFPMKNKFDAIFCRNVVIYFDKATQKKLFTRMSKYLQPNGFLYIGHSENITNISDEWELIGRTIYRLKGN
jgi:chemotaxis protein methyltransferase CheR